MKRCSHISMILSECFKSLYARCKVPGVVRLIEPELVVNQASTSTNTGLTVFHLSKLKRNFFQRKPYCQPTSDYLIRVFVMRKAQVGEEAVLIEK